MTTVFTVTLEKHEKAMEPAIWGSMMIKSEDKGLDMEVTSKFNKPAHTTGAVAKAYRTLRQLGFVLDGVPLEHLQVHDSARFSLAMRRA